MYKPGQIIYGIEVIDDEWEEAEVSGYLFMAECQDYILCCSQYMHLEGDFESQLDEMYEESINDMSVSINMLRKDLCFDTYQQAEDYLTEMKDYD